MKKFILFLFIFFSCFNAYATEYWVSTNGSDAGCTGLSSADYDGSGTGEACAFSTAQTAVDAASSPGDIVTIRDGSYSEGFLMDTNSGTADSPKDITGITKANPVVVTVPSHGYSNGDAIYIDGLNETTGMDQLPGQLWYISNVTTNTFTLTGEDGSNYQNYISGGTATKWNPITVRAEHKGAVTFDTSLTVSGWDNTGLPDNTYLSDTVSDSGTIHVLWKQGQGTILLPVAFDSVDSEGEASYDTVTDKWKIFTLGDPNGNTYKTANANLTVQVKGVSYIVIDGINGEYGSSVFKTGYDSPTGAGSGTSYIVLQNVQCQLSTGLGCITFTTASTRPTTHVTVNHSSIAYTSEVVSGANAHGIKFAANNNADSGAYAIVANSVFHDVWQHGIQISNGWVQGHFYNNRMYNGSVRALYGGSGGGGTDIRVGTAWPGPDGEELDQGALVHDNELGGLNLDGTGDALNSGIFVQEGVFGVKIYRNYIHNHDWHGIYAFASSAGLGYYGHDNYIYNNIIYKNDQSGVRVEECQSIYLFNNTFDENGAATSSGAALNLNDAAADGVVAMNNIFNTSNRNSLTVSFGQTITSDYNIHYVQDASQPITYNSTSYDLSTFSTLTGNDKHSLILSPIFNGIATHDYTLNSLSPALQAGNNLSQFFTTDYAKTHRGFLWDIGAYQNSAETSLEGVIIN